MSVGTRENFTIDISHVQVGVEVGVEVGVGVEVVAVAVAAIDFTWNYLGLYIVRLDFWVYIGRLGGHSHNL